MTYRILLYYHYVHMEDPIAFRDAHRELCRSLDLKGRIIIAEEGINGTVSGTIENTQAYMTWMEGNPLFTGMPFKMDFVEEHQFPKMSVKVRPELVNLSLDNDVNPLELTGNHLKPEEFLKHMQDQNTVVIDARNDYEYDLGHFRGALRPDIETFRELPQWIKENGESLEGKKILTYCTGGVRCEKFSGWLRQEGYEDVNQLDGGIVTYGYDEVAQGQLWDGMCYVFDNRISVPINRTEHTVVGVDYFDGQPCERYVDCANPSCNKQIITSVENQESHLGSCTRNCVYVSNNRYVKAHQMSSDEIEERLIDIVFPEEVH